MKKHIAGTTAFVAVLSLTLAASAQSGQVSAPPIGDGPVEPVVRDTWTQYEPTITHRSSRLTLEVPLSFGLRVEDTSGFGVDRYGTEYNGDPTVNGFVRVGANMNIGAHDSVVNVGIVYEHDLFTGVALGFDHEEPDALYYPENNRGRHHIRNAHLRIDVGPRLHLLAGIATSHWGMGLVANDGAHGWTPGSAQFVDPRGGDTVARGMLILGPVSDNNLMFTLGGDYVIDDDAMLTSYELEREAERLGAADPTLDGDRAWQLTFSARYGYKKPTEFGAYFVMRRQTAGDDAETRVQVADVYARHEANFGNSLRLKLEAEGAIVFGTTELSPSPEHPESDVLQGALAARASLQFGRAGFVLDGLYASGDRNFDDGRQNGFGVDANFPMGFIYHRYVTAAHTARTELTAGDLSLVGIPADDLERFPTRGRATNTISIFPRLFVQAGELFEFYGGAMIAMNAVPGGDPFNARLDGGVPRNALGGAAERLQGVEADLGVRFQRLLDNTELTVGFEAGAFFPGPGLHTIADETMDTVIAGRGMLDYRF